MGEVIDSHQSTGSIRMDNVTIYGGNTAISMGALYVHLINVRVFGTTRAISTRDNIVENIVTGITYRVTPIKEFIIDGAIMDKVQNGITISVPIDTFIVNNVTAENLTGIFIPSISDAWELGSFDVSNIKTNAPIFSGALKCKMLNFNNINIVTNDNTYDFSILKINDNSIIKYLNINGLKLYNNNHNLLHFIYLVGAALTLNNIVITDCVIDCQMNALDTDAHFFRLPDSMLAIPDLNISNSFLYDNKQWNYFLFKNGSDVSGLNLRMYNFVQDRDSANEYYHFIDLNITEY